MKDGADSPKRRLLSFTEAVKSKKSENTEFAGSKKSECNLREGEVVSLDVLVAEDEAQSSIVISYKDGSVGFVARDLSRLHWDSGKPIKSGEDYEVEYSTVVPIDSARRGLLKGRADIVAQLDAMTVPTKASQLLCRLFRSGSKRGLELYALRIPDPGQIQSTTGALQFLTSYPLPGGQHHPKQSPHLIDLHASSGTLCQLLDEKLSLYDLSGTVPQLSMTLGSKLAPITSFARLSNSSVLTLTHGTATIYETSFGSIQASISLQSSFAAGEVGKKRKRSEDAENAPLFQAISAFPDVGLILGLDGQDLVAVQLQGLSRDRKSVSAPATLLRDVLGKGSYKQTRNQERDSKKVRKWEEWTAKVDQLVAAEEIEALEKLVANEKKLGRQRKIEKLQDDQEESAAEDVDATTYEEMWPLPEAFDPQDVDKRKAMYLLSKIFGRGSGQDGALQILIPSLKLLEWLTLTSLLSVTHLKKALSSNAGGLAATLNPGDVMTAIRKLDDDFQLMHDLLSLPVYWEAAEVVQALRLVIQSLNAPVQQQQQDGPLALPAPAQPNGHPTADKDVEMTNGDDHEIESESELELAAVENELDLVMHALDAGLEVKSDTLRLITSRLHAFPPRSITTLMRSMLSQSEIVFFIHILRIELADGGWTSSYVAADETDEQEGILRGLGEDEESRPSDGAIKAIGDLLNCAVDAIGTTGWLVGLSSAALATDELVDSLRAEVSAGLDGCFQAKKLGIWLRELEKSVDQQGTNKFPGRVIQVQENGLEDANAALLSLEPRGGVAKIASGKSANDKRSVKARAREKSKLVGKYSFERIRI